MALTINAPAMSSEMSVEYTPTSPNWAPAGFRRGPSKLKAVRTCNGHRSAQVRLSVEPTLLQFGS
eukprot:1160740-Pelagomonas_calceolata.AAC.3